MKREGPGKYYLELGIHLYRSYSGQLVEMRLLDHS